MTPRFLDGWKEIAARLGEHAHLPISIDQAKRYARRRNQPLPVRRIGPGKRKRVVADPSALAEWARDKF